MSGLTLLHRVAVKGYLSIAEELIKRGANFRARDRNGATPLHKAASSGHLNVIQLLLQNGADIHSDDATGATALHKASWTGEKDVVSWLLENGAHVDRRDSKLATPLQYACHANHKEIGRILLEAKANPNSKDARGNSALLDCCTRGTLDCMDLLIAQKADILLVNKGGYSPLMEAVRAKQAEIVRSLLRRYGMESLGGPEVWQKALKIAKASGDEAILQMLVHANGTEIIRENIYKNLKIVHGQYEALRERLGKAEYLYALLDRHSFYGKTNAVQKHVEQCEPMLARLLEGVENPTECPENMLHEARAYKDAQIKLREMVDCFEENLTIGAPPVAPETLTEEAIQQMDSETSEEGAAEAARERERISSSNETAKRAEERYKRKQELHEEIEGNLQGVMSKMVQIYPSSDSGGDWNFAAEKFLEWKAKVTAEVVESMRRIDHLSRQLHDGLLYVNKLMKDQSKCGEQVVAQLVHATLGDQIKQKTTAQQVEDCRAHQEALRILLKRAEEREEQLLQVELEERRKRAEEERLKYEERRRTSARANMSDEEAMRLAEMEVEKYKRRQEYSPETFRRLTEAKRQAILQKQREDFEADELRVEFPEQTFQLPDYQKPNVANKVFMSDLEDSPFDVPEESGDTIESFDQTVSSLPRSYVPDFPEAEAFPEPEDFPEVQDGLEDDQKISTQSPRNDSFEDEDEGKTERPQSSQEVSEEDDVDDISRSPPRDQAYSEEEKGDPTSNQAGDEESFEWPSSKAEPGDLGFEFGEGTWEIATPSSFPEFSEDFEPLEDLPNKEKENSPPKDASDPQWDDDDELEFAN